MVLPHSYVLQLRIRAWSHAAHENEGLEEGYQYRNAGCPISTGPSVISRRVATEAHTSRPYGAKASRPLARCGGDSFMRSHGE